LAGKIGQADGIAPELAEDMAWLLFDQARIADGEAPHDPAAFSQRFSRRIAENLKS
jgi:molecular chaperone HtpG